MKLKNKDIEIYLHEQLTSQSADSYFYTIERFLSSNPNAENYSRRDVMDYFDKISKNTTEAYRAKILAAIKMYYDCTLELGVREKHPCKSLKIKVHRSKKVQIQNLFSSQELEDLFVREDRYKFVQSRNKLILSLLIYQGLTSYEIVHLKLKDIYLEDGYIHIRDTTARVHSRKLSIYGKQYMWIERYLEARNEHLKNNKIDNFIVSKLRSSISVDGIHSMFDQLKSLFPDRELSPKTIRMSVIANWLNESGKSIDEVMELSGIKNPSTLENYIQDITEKSHDMIKQFHPLNHK